MKLMAKKTHRPSRRRSLLFGLLLTAILVVWALAGEWYVHHSRKWLCKQAENYPAFITEPLLWMGNPVADITDALGWTGHDAVYEYDTEAPSGQVFFAGAPRRVDSPAPTDVVVLDRGSFKIGWSQRLRHPLWCAYHVTPKFRYNLPNRPSFQKDASVASAPQPNDYMRSGYDRGHMVPNFAIASRYGEASQKLTFLMSNVAPQSPALNRGVWRDIEHRIAEFWTRRYGEIWVVVGAIPSASGMRIGQTGIDIPDAYYQVIMAQEGFDIRALAILIPQTVSWDAWGARHILTIDELEKLTGLDFNPDLPLFIQDPMEAELPTRLWPVCPGDVIRQILGRYKN